MSGLPRSANTFSKDAAPSNYIAGMGRGAMGFVTSQDVGPARVAPGASIGAPGRGLPQRSNYADHHFGAAPAGYVAGRGRGMGALASTQAKEGKEDGDLSESNYDSFSGYGGASGVDESVYGADDAEADDIYAKVDKTMAERHDKKRQAAEMVRVNGTLSPSQALLLVDCTSHTSSLSPPSLPPPLPHRRKPARGPVPPSRSSLRTSNRG